MVIMLKLNRTTRNRPEKKTQVGPSFRATILSISWLPEGLDFCMLGA